MPVLPTGTVTFLFTDFQGSTKLWEENPEGMRLALARYDNLLKKAIEDNEGVIFKTVGDGFCAAFAIALNNLGNVASDQRDQAAARLFFEESLAISRASGEPKGIYTALLNIGELHFNAKEYFAAGLAWRECLSIAVEHTLKASTAWALLWLAGVIAVTDTSLEAARIWGLLVRMKDENGGSLPTGFKETMDPHVLAARTALNDDAAFDAAWQEGRALSVEEAVALAQQATHPRTFIRSRRET